MEFLNVGDKLQHNSGQTFTVVGMTLEIHPDFDANEYSVLVKLVRDDGEKLTVQPSYIAKSMKNMLLVKVDADAN